MRHATVILLTILSILPMPKVRASKTVPDIPHSHSVRAHGAVGDGKTLDTAAINRAIEAASAAGGGTVHFPAGSYLSATIRLRSNITLHIDAGAKIIAADTGYDAPEPNKWGDLKYQDFGHSHWANSLIHGDGLENIAITGHGLIDGRGLNRGWGATEGSGNKTIALRLCRNVTLRDFSVYHGGHFALLATGVDNLTIDNLRIDTNRDALDIDCCRHVRISNCSLNTPNDDAIVLKTSYALGEVRPTEHVTITNCSVTGYDLGTLLDGTYRRTLAHSPDRDGPTGRIKFGTESNGPFRNITISNIVFDRSRGIALESVDGSEIEDIAISNITMRDVSNAPLFIRLGNRARGPKGTPGGSIKRVTIDNLVASDADGRFPAFIISGIPGHHIENIRLSNIRVETRGGLTMKEIAAQPDALVNAFFLRGGAPGVQGKRAPYAVPERDNAYPEPSMFGLLPATALYARHVKNLQLHNVEVATTQPDERPALVLEDIDGITLRDITLPEPAKAKSAWAHLTDVKNFIHNDAKPKTVVRTTELKK
ncbi:polygalacturonase [Ereboglobus sp. PH5-10]|uniref:rhamnogalacturonidase n=1 Tax=Ereboglobus sp. PH5-10 TaxID=2940629 RepID=UPI00240738DB|nr:glycosyl hydrolase family 28-related protein [Ereboglobus sp. PH5-10]MDF9828150.1 polygalacturonase [Ereboglobus sp. PH5-10]